MKGWRHHKNIFSKHKIVDITTKNIWNWTIHFEHLNPHKELKDNHLELKTFDSENNYNLNLWPFSSIWVLIPRMEHMALVRFIQMKINAPLECFVNIVVTKELQIHLLLSAWNNSCSEWNVMQKADLVTTHRSSTEVPGIVNVASPSLNPQVLHLIAQWSQTKMEVFQKWDRSSWKKSFNINGRLHVEEQTWTIWALIPCGEDSIFDRISKETE